MRIWQYNSSLWAGGRSPGCRRSQLCPLSPPVRASLLWGADARPWLGLPSLGFRAPRMPRGSDSVVTGASRWALWQPVQLWLSVVSQDCWWICFTNYFIFCFKSWFKYFQLDLFAPFWNIILAVWPCRVFDPSFQAAWWERFQMSGPFWTSFKEQVWI